MRASIFDPPPFKGPLAAFRTTALGALALLGAEPPAPSTLKALSAAAGWAPAAARRLYPDEARILRFLMKEIGTALERMFDSAEAGGGGSIDRMARFLEANFRLIEEHPGVAALLYRPPSGPNRPDAAPERERLLRKLLARLEKTVALGRETREFRREIDPAMAAMHFIGLVRMTVAFWELGGRNERLAVLGRPLWEQFLDGIKA